MCFTGCTDSPCSAVRMRKTENRPETSRPEGQKRIQTGLGFDSFVIEQIEYFIKKQMDVIAVAAGDCDLMACQRIVEGTQNMTAFKSMEEDVYLNVRK